MASILQKTPLNQNFPEENLAKISLAERALSDVSEIRQRFEQQDKIDEMLKKEGLQPVLRLSIGQPHLKSSPVQKLAMDDVHEGRDSIPEGYTPSKGLKKYIRYATELFNHRIPGIDIKDENVLFTSGGTGALSMLSAVLFSSSTSKAIFPTPGFVCHPETMKTYGANVIHLSTDSAYNYKISPEKLDKTLAENNVSLFVLNDVTNPTGIKYTENELKEIGDVLRKYPNVLIFSDETYHDLAFDDKSKFFLEVNPDLKNRTIVQYSFSKDNAGNPAIRGGLVYAPDVIDQNGQKVNLANKMALQQYRAITGIPTISQFLMARIIEAKINRHFDKESLSWQGGGRYHEEHKAWEQAMKQEYKSNSAIAKSEFEKVGMPAVVESGGGFFLFIDAGKFIGKKVPDMATSFNGLKLTDLHNKVGSEILDTDTKVVSYLALVANMVCVEGSPFGSPPEKGMMRVSVANTKENLSQTSSRVEFADKTLVKSAMDRLLEARQNSPALKLGRG